MCACMVEGGGGRWGVFVDCACVGEGVWVCFCLWSEYVCVCG